MVILSGDAKKRPTRSEIGEMLALTEEGCHVHLKLIMNHGKNFLVNFEQGFDVSKLYEKKTCVNNVTYYLVNPFEHDVYATFRILGVPPTLQEEIIIDHFEKSGVKVLGVTHDTFKVRDVEVPNGNARVKVKTKSSDNKIFNIKRGDVTLGVFEVMIIKAGEKLKCRKCNSTGHFARDCTTTCKTCNQVGHIAAQCNMAKKLGQQEINENADNQNELGDDDEDKGTDTQDNKEPQPNEQDKVNETEPHENEEIINETTKKPKRSRDENQSPTSSSGSPDPKYKAIENSE